MTADAKQLDEETANSLAIRLRLSIEAVKRMAPVEVALMHADQSASNVRSYVTGREGMENHLANYMASEPLQVLAAEVRALREQSEWRDRLLVPTDEDAKAALYGWCNADPATKVLSTYQQLPETIEAWKRAMVAFVRHVLPAPPSATDSEGKADG